MFTHAAATVLAVTLTAFGFGGGHGHDPGHDRDHGHAAVAQARHAIAPFHRLAVAKRAGYGVLSDAAGIQCIDNPGVGGMGVHVVNGTLVGDGAVRASTPEALVYEPTRHGGLRLVAAEYVVLQADWDAAHSAPPTLFGQTFELVPVGNRYGLPAFYELHAWLFARNPLGMFDDWNPRVSCARSTEAY